MRVLDLFSCIGGHALGLHAAGNFETIQFVEANQFRRRILARHFPGIPIHEDVRSYRGVAADIIIGGPPCQRTSCASAIHGKRDGFSLWGEMRRIVQDSQPRWGVVEQPPGNAAWEDSVTRGLAEVGLSARWVDLSAECLGALHKRRRRFAIANASVPRLEIARQAIPREIERVARGAFARNPWHAPYTGTVGIPHGLPGGLDRRERIEAIGDSNPPFMMTVIGRAILAAEGA